MNRIKSFADSQAILNMRQEEKQKAIPAADKNASFFDKQEAEYAADPTPFSIYNSCINTGHDQAFELQRAYRDHTHSNHATALATFKAHGYDFDRVRLDCMNSMVKKFSAKRLTPRNRNYENAVLNALQPAPGNPDDAGAVRKARAALTDKWQQRGYVAQKDDDVLMNFLRDNKLSSAMECMARVSDVVDNYFGDKKLLNLMDLKNSASPAAQKMKQLRDDTKREEIRRKEKNDDLEDRKKTDAEIQKTAKKGMYDSTHGSVIASRMNELRGIR